MGSNLESLIKFPIKGRIVQSTKTSLKLAFLSTGHVANYHRIRVRPWLALFFCTPAGINSTDHGHHTNIFKTRSKSPMRLYRLRTGTPTEVTNYLLPRLGPAIWASVRDQFHHCIQSEPLNTRLILQWLECFNILSCRLSPYNFEWYPTKNYC